MGWADRKGSTSVQLNSIKKAASRIKLAVRVQFDPSARPFQEFNKLRKLKVSTFDEENGSHTATRCSIRRGISCLYNTVKPAVTPAHSHIVFQHYIDTSDIVSYTGSCPDWACSVKTCGTLGGSIASRSKEKNIA